MVPWPRSLGVRLLLVGCLAVIAIALLEFALRAAERRNRPPLPHQELLLEPDAAPVADLGVRAGSIVLHYRAPVPEAAAPRLRVVGDAFVVVRPAPLPQRPGRQTVPVAAIQLPAAGLAGLDPRQRAGLLEALAALLPDRPVEPSRVRGADVAVDAAELGILLSWLR